MQRYLPVTVGAQVSSSHIRFCATLFAVVLIRNYSGDTYFVSIRGVSVVPSMIARKIPSVLGLIWHDTSPLFMVRDKGWSAVSLVALGLSSDVIICSDMPTTIIRQFASYTGCVGAVVVCRPTDTSLRYEE